jgi:lycopene beta-cyclase
MSQATAVDLLILGGGCAGLSLARELAQRDTQASVRVIEPREAYEDDRSWCFWAANDQRLFDGVGHTWAAWLFNVEGQPRQARSCPGYSYQYVRAKDFYRLCQEAITGSSHVLLQLGESVTDLQPHAAGWRVTTSRGEYLATQVVDTRPPLPQVLKQSTLFQCFLGVEILLDSPVERADAVELMTDMRLLDGDFCFTYVLPHSERHLLAEVTVFSREPWSREALIPELHRLLAQRGWVGAEVLKTEYGLLPMGLPESAEGSEGPLSAGKQLLIAGTRGGALRASSGYGFLRIQRWAEACAKQYVANNTLAPAGAGAGAGAGYWLPRMDKLFLAVLKRYPHLTPTLFDRLLSRASAERFIRFMDDRATVVDCLQIVACLPKRLFLKTLLSMVWKRQ